MYENVSLQPVSVVITPEVAVCILFLKQDAKIGYLFTDAPELSSVSPVDDSDEERGGSSRSKIIYRLVSTNRQVMTKKKNPKPTEHSLPHPNRKTTILDTIKYETVFNPNLRSLQ